VDGPHSSRRIVVGIAWALCAGSLSLSLYTSRTGALISPDAAHTAVVARNLVRGEGFVIDFVPFHAGTFESVRHVPEMHGLLQPVVLAPFFALFGVEDATVRIPGLVYAALTGLVAFYLARRLFGDAAGLAACVLTLTSATLFRIGESGLDDAGFAFFCLWGTSMLERGLSRQRPRDFALSGLLMGLALLAKPMGFFLPGLLVVTLLQWRSLRARGIARLCLFFLLPFAACAAVYFARNLVAHGGLGFRFGALEWIYKIQGFEGFFALHPVPPTLGEIVASIGWSEVFAIQWEQVERFARAAFLPPRGPLARSIVSPWTLAPLGLATGLLHLRQQRVFGALVLASVLGSVAFVSLLYHFEARYFAMLGPLFAVSVAGVVAWGQAVRPRRGALSRLARLAAWALVAVLVLQSGLLLARMQQRALIRLAASGPCPGAVEWIRSKTPADDAVLVLHPATNAWLLERPAIMIPTGGLEEILEVARRYDARWMLGHRSMIRPYTGRYVAELGDVRGDGYSIETVFQGARCRVHRLDLAASARRR